MPIKEVKAMTYEEKRAMSLTELEDALRAEVARYDWGAFLAQAEPVWIDFRKPEKPLVFLMPDFKCPCGGSFFINIHFTAMPNGDHQRNCPFRESANCTRRHRFQVLIKTQRDAQSGHLNYFAVFRIPITRGWRWVEVSVPIAIVDDRGSS
jgi:hypothetical protein